MPLRSETTNPEEGQYWQDQQFMNRFPSRSISQSYRTFSGSDALCFIHIRGFIPKLMGQITTVSYSIRRSTQPVNVLGKNKIRGFTKGPSFVAGSMFFSMIDQNIVKEFEALLHESIPRDRRNWRLDELPPFNLIIIAANEYGAASHMTLDNVTFTDEAGIVSINDIITETQTSYLARDVKPFASYDPMTGVGLEDVFIFEQDHISDDDYNIFRPSLSLPFPDNGATLEYVLNYFKIDCDYYENEIVFKKPGNILQSISFDNADKYGLALTRSQEIKKSKINNIQITIDALLSY